MLKRNITCLTFLVNEKGCSVSTVLEEKFDYSGYEFIDKVEVVDIGIMVSEFLLGNGIEEHCLLKCVDSKDSSSVELWSEPKGFYIKFCNASNEVEKSIRADLFIKVFTDMEEFHIYMADFLRTRLYWLQGVVPKTPEPDLLSNLTERTVELEKKLKRYALTIERLENEIEEQNESIRTLIALVERLNTRRSGSR